MDKTGAESIEKNALDWIEALKEFVPEKQVLDFENDSYDKENETQQKIDDANQKAEDKILTAYLKAEAQRLNQQKPLMLFLMIIFGVQLVAFNTLMFLFVLICINKDSGSFVMIADFLKYYIGAIIVEIIGMIAVMVNSTFSTHNNKLVQSIFNKK